MRINRIFTVAILVFSTLTALATIPSGYYSTIAGQSNDNILIKLNAKISGHTTISYNNLEPYYRTTDWRANGTLWDMYSTCTFTMADANKSQKAVCDGWNKEHSIPQSWFNKQSPMKSDLFHVYPTDARVNNIRGNNPYGECAGSNGTGISNNTDNHALGKVGTSTFSGYSGRVYEPADEYKGDFARTYFYMVARYRSNNLSSSTGSVVFTSTPTNLTTYAKALFLKWHREDPVSQKEIDRNNAVYGIQGNRNPFIDYPYIVEYIWGTKQGQSVDFSQIISSEDPAFIPSISDGSMVITSPTLIAYANALTYEPILVGSTATATVSVMGANLTSAIDATISGTDAALFRVSPATVAAAQANGTHTFTVTYAPTATGNHTATLTVASAGATPQTITLNASAAAVCTVSWKVNGVMYTAGNPTTQVAEGGHISAVPTAPASFSATSETFVGWTAMPIVGISQDAPSDLFADETEAQIINGNTIFHAVFAHMEQSGNAGSQSVSCTYSDNDGWTATALGTGGNGNNRYWILHQGGSLESPEIDLAYLRGITVNMRTYGGVQYKTLDIYAGSTLLGSLEAKGKNLANYKWTNTESLNGSSPITFSSTTSSATNGPGVRSITIDMSAPAYIYSDYITSIGGTGTKIEDTKTLEKHVIEKIIIGGQLYIRIDGALYNSMGQRIE